MQELSYGFYAKVNTPSTSGACCCCLFSVSDLHAAVERNLERLEGQRAPDRCYHSGRAWFRKKICHRRCMEIKLTTLIQTKTCPLWGGLNVHLVLFILVRVGKPECSVSALKRCCIFCMELRGFKSKSFSVCLDNVTAIMVLPHELN